MLKVFLASHGHLASGMKSSVDLLLGASAGLRVYDAYLNGQDDHNLEDVLKAYISELSDDDTLVLCSDLYGGSVNQQMALFLQRPHTYLVAGVNLGFILELVLKSEINKEELVQIIEDSKNALCLVELEKIDLESVDDFF